MLAVPRQAAAELTRGLPSLSRSEQKGLEEAPPDTDHGSEPPLATAPAAQVY